MVFYSSQISLDNFLSEFYNLKNCDENIIKNKKISFKKRRVYVFKSL